MPMRSAPYPVAVTVDPVSTVALLAADRAAPESIAALALVESPVRVESKREHAVNAINVAAVTEPTWEGRILDNGVV